MKNIKLLIILFTISSGFFVGCKEKSPLDGEQYFKQVYIVGSDQTSDLGLRTVEVPYSSEEQETSVSISTGGSQNIDRDITVLLKEAGSAAIDDYNFKYLEDDDVKYQLLDAAFYSIPDYDVTIKSGEVYGVVPVKINTNGLNADSLYAITLQIDAVSDPDYINIRKADSVLILSFKFINEFSGSYQMSGYYYPWADGASAGDSVSISASRNLTAINENTVRFYHLATNEFKANLEDYGVTLSVAADNSISVASWANMEINDAGGTYDPETGTIDFWYNYMAGDKEYQFAGVLTKDDTE